MRLFIGPNVRKGSKRTRCNIASGTGVPGALLTCGDRREGPQRIGFEPFAKRSGNGRSLRTAAVPKSEWPDNSRGADNSRSIEWQRDTPQSISYDKAALAL